MHSLCVGLLTSILGHMSLYEFCHLWLLLLLLTSQLMIVPTAENIAQTLWG